jgi:hypothetical protein
MWRLLRAHGIFAGGLGARQLKQQEGNAKSKRAEAPRVVSSAAWRRAVMPRLCLEELKTSGCGHNRSSAMLAVALLRVKRTLPSLSSPRRR